MKYGKKSRVLVTNGLYRNFHFCGRLPHPIHGRGIPCGSVHHFKPKRVLTRPHPVTKENLHQRFAQHRGAARRAGGLRWNK